jgi:hypothetical protein
MTPPRPQQKQQKRPNRKRRSAGGEDDEQQQQQQQQAKHHRPEKKVKFQRQDGAGPAPGRAGSSSVIVYKPVMRNGRVEPLVHPRGRGQSGWNVFQARYRSTGAAANTTASDAWAKMSDKERLDFSNNAMIERNMEFLRKKHGNQSRRAVSRSSGHHQQRLSAVAFKELGTSLSSSSSSNSWRHAGLCFVFCHAYLAPQPPSPALTNQRTAYFFSAAGRTFVFSLIPKTTHRHLAERP